MCGRYTFRAKSLGRIAGALDADLPEPEARYNIAPGQPAPVVLEAEDGYRARDMRWGLVPHWSKTPTTRYSTINAKVETLAEKPVYRDAFRRRRCLVPADGYYEWRREGDRKQPYYIHQDGRVFAFAGLWDRWQGEGADPFDSYSIVTGPATAPVSELHPRMPIILPEAAWREWLDPRTSPVKLADLLARPETALMTHPVSTRVNNPRNEGPELIRPVTEKGSE